MSTLERITVVGGAPLPAPERITPDAARRLTDEFTVIPKNAPNASREASTRFAANLALRDVLQGAASPASLAVVGTEPVDTLSAAGAVVGGTVTGVPSSVSTLGSVTAPLGSLAAPLGGATAPLLPKLP